MTQTAEGPQLAELLRENARLKKVVAHYQEIDQAQKQVIADLRKRIEIRTISNKKYSANEKLFLDAAHELIRKEKPNDKGLVRLPIAEVAESIGASEDTGSRLLKSLTERFGATHNKVPYITKNGQKLNLSYINPEELLWQAPQVAEPVSPEKERNHGGDRRCSCGGKLHVKERPITSQQYTVCEECGTQTIYPVRQVNEPLDVNYEAPQLAELEDNPQPAEDSEMSNVLDIVEEEQVAELRKTADLPVCTEPATAPGDTLADPPTFLRRKAIWCCWRWGRDEQGNPTKVPFIANNLGKQKASVSDLTTWRAHAYAIAVYEQSQQRQGTFTDNKGVEYTYRFDGIGFMCDGTFTFLDQDHCCNPETGEIDASALERARSINSYTEPSVSGHGLHTYAEGTIEANRKHQGVEMYSTVRFCVYTGCPLPDFPQEVESRQDELRALHRAYFPARAEYLWSIESDDTSERKSDDEMEQLLADVKARMARAKNAEKCMKLWAGDCSDYNNDHSRADAAFCKMLAHYVGKSVFIVDWLLRKSGLMRPKWERADYRERTFRCAFSGEQILS